MSDFNNRSRSLARDRYWEKHSRENYNCPDCDRGQDDIIGKFQVHHKSGNPHDNRLDQLIGLCGFCHKLREDKKPSLKRIKRFQKQDNSETVNAEKRNTQYHSYPRIYTAGRMVYENNEDSRYRAAIDMAFESKDKARFLHPTDTYFDHGGEQVSGCVAEDIEMIDKSDGIIAFFEEKGQTGTLTELFHALRTDTPALVLLSEGYTVSGPKQEFSDTPSPVGRITLRCESKLWFLINYLNGDKTTNFYGSSRHDKSWDGTDVTTVAVSKGDGSIEATVESWIDNNLQSVDYNNTTPDEVEKASKIADPDESDPEVLSDE